MVVIEKRKGKTKEMMFREFTRSYLEDEFAKKIKEKLFYKRPSQVNKEKKKLYRSNKKRRRSHTQ